MTEPDRIAYLLELSRRGDDAAGAWHTAFRAVEDAIIALVRNGTPANEQALRDAFTALRTASATRSTLLSEQVAAIVAPFQLQMMTLQEAIERIDQREAHVSTLAEKRFDAIMHALEAARTERMAQLDAMRQELRQLREPGP